MAISEPADRLFTRAFGFLIVSQLLQSIGYASMILLPLYLEFLGAGRAQIGTIMGVGAAGGLLFRPAVAWALDAVGRKITLTVGTAILGASLIALGAVDRLGTPMYLVRIGTGIGIGVLFTGYFTLASDHIPMTRRTEGLALFGIFGLLGLVVNPLAELFGVGGGSLRWFFPGVGITVLLSLLFLAPVPEASRRQPKGQGIRLSEALRALTARPLWSVWVATIVFSSLVAAYMAFATVSAASAGVERPGLIWGAYALGAVAVRAVGARLPDRLGPANLVAPALGCYVLAMVLAASGSAFGFSGLLAGVAHGYCFPVVTSQVVTRTPDRLTGSGLAMFTGLWDLSRFAVTPLLGVFAEGYGDAAMFALAAVAAVVGLAVWTVLEAVWGVARIGTLDAS